MPDFNKFVGAAVVACALPLASCAETDQDTIGAQVTIIDRRMDAITAAGINFIDGTYTGCTGYDDGDGWSLKVTGNPTMTHSALAVIKGDSYASCKLAITHIHTSADGLLAANVGSIALDTSYGTARSFGTPDIKFYANGLLSAGNFNNAFTLTLLFSDDARVDNTKSSTATYAVVSATASADDVTAPNYSLSLAGVAVTTDIAQVTVSVSGNLVLSGATSTGEFYAIVNSSVGDTYAEIKTAYDGASKTAIAANIAASSLLATNVDLTNDVARTLIISRTENGVTSYQKFVITFEGPN